MFSVFKPQGKLLNKYVLEPKLSMIKPKSFNNKMFFNSIPLVCQKELKLQELRDFL